MILPITAYGDPVLKKVTQDITPEYPGLKALIDNMWETMYSAEGVGLAAPQVGLDIRMAVIDASPFATDDELPKDEREFLKTFKKVFINPHISERWGEPWGMEEGCLSLPGIHEKVFRPDEFTGYAARVIQHEYDHLDGKVFTDHLSPLTRRMIQKRLSSISEGRVKTHYPMRFPRRK